MANAESEMKVKEAVKLIENLGTTESDLNFKAEVLKSFLSERNLDYIPRPSGIEQQKFILFYSLFSFIKGGENYSFHTLKHFPQGPVYCDVFTLANKTVYVNKLATQKIQLDKEIIDMTLLLMYLFGKDGISKLTHSLDFWKNTKRGYDCAVAEKGLTENDKLRLEKLYAELQETNEKFILFQNYNNKVLLIQKEYYKEITDNFLAELNKYDETTLEPLYVYLIEGELVID